MKHVIEDHFSFEEIDEVAEIESFRKEVNRPIYHIHKWWAKRLGTVFRAIVSGSLSEDKLPKFYEKHDFKGKVVLDPFMGSGTTLGEALKLGASVIGCDVNPVSSFSVTQSLTSLPQQELEEEFKAIEHDVKNEILSYYQTMVPESSKPCQALYYFWVKIVTTPEGEEIPLFSSYIFSKNAYPSRKPLAKILCPSCGEVLEGRYDSQQEICNCCFSSFNPQAGPVKGTKVTDSAGRQHKVKELIGPTKQPPQHKLYAIMALNEQGEKVYIKPSKYDFDLLEKAKRHLSERENELPLPSMSVRDGFNTSQARGYNYTNWRDFFNDRQLLSLGILLSRILKVENPTLRDHFICLFSGTLEFNNMFCSFKGEGTGAVRHMFSNHILKPERTPLENSVWGLSGKSSGCFSTLFKSRLLKAKKYLEEPFELKRVIANGKKRTEKVICSNPINVDVVTAWKDFQKIPQSALVLNGDSSSLPVPNNYVDSIVTDPPYFDFVHYSELSDFFYAWLSPALGRTYDYLNRQDSSHQNEVQDRNKDRFSLKIGRIFQECHRVLKNDGLMCFSFHHSHIDGWLAIYKAVTLANFDIVNAHPVKAEMSVSSPKSSSKKPINIDAILVCKKESSPPSVKSPLEEINARYFKLLKRFNNLGRELSQGDLFVICCSQTVSVASCLRLSVQQTETLMNTAIEELVNKAFCKV